MEVGQSLDQGFLTRKINFRVPSNSLPTKTHVGLANLIAGREIKLLLNVCEKVYL
jgi:hypothetical protein